MEVPAAAGLYNRYVPQKPSNPSSNSIPSANGTRQLQKSAADGRETSSKKGSLKKKDKKDKKSSKEDEKTDKSIKKDKKAATLAKEEKKLDKSATEGKQEQEPRPEKAATLSQNDEANLDASDSSAVERTKTETLKKKKSDKSGMKRKRDDVEAHDDGSAGEVKRSKHDQKILAKFEKASKISEKLRKKQLAKEQATQVAEQKEPSPPQELHDLVPLPQPENPAPEDFKQTFSSLPDWITTPILAQADFKPPFSQFPLSKRVLRNLESAGYKETFPIQATLIPMLMPGKERYYGDICVSAPTGSGKTLGYILPLIERLKEKVISQLRAVVVVPTRELVTQAYDDATRCAARTNIRIGTAYGRSSLATEQDQLVFKDQVYEPEAAAEMHRIAKDRLETGFWEDDSLLDDVQTLLPHHIVEYRSHVDLLICTPGRLVEHITSTPGFSLAHVECLIVDEADRLLDDSFQEWVGVILKAFDTQRNPTSSIPRPWDIHESKGVQKVILSATMARDLTKLAALRLCKPTLVAVAGSTSALQSVPETSAALVGPNSVELPPTLHEVAIPVGDGGDKPLYLLQILEERLGLTADSLSTALDEQDLPSTSSKSSDSDPSDGSDSDDDSKIHAKSPKKRAGLGGLCRVLVFTNSNEDAMRLSHILSSMRPELASRMGTLTKTSSRVGRKTLSAFKARKIVLLIASDRASRGLDVPDLTDVISYDMPRDQTLYVHRVGRTARAGRSGTAWSLFTKSEGRWFWNSIARAQEIRRPAGAVERWNMVLSESDDVRTRYDAALESLKTAVLGT